MKSIPKYTGPFPFVGTQPKFPKWELIKCILMTPIAVVRIILIILCLLFMWIFCKLATMDLGCKNNLDEPLSYFRKFWLLIVRLLSRTILLIAGFYWIPVRNLQTSDYKANIIVANHRSLYDQFKIFFEFGCSGATRIENTNIPLLGAITKASQSVVVDRLTHDGRQFALKQIEDRSHQRCMPPLLVFPQGTTSNRYCLTGFKKGAFSAGVPVQPVCIKYTCSQMDLYLGTRSMGYYTYWSLCQFVNRVQFDYLEVYYPTAAEIEDPELFATNVQKTMANHMGILTSEHTFADVRLFKAAKTNKVKIDFLVKDAKQVLGVTLEDIISYLPDYSKSGMDSFREYLNK